MTKYRKSNTIAVSEVLGTIFLLLISATLISVVSVTLSSIAVKTEAPTVDIVFYQA
jgi:hypothetical protein